MAETFYLHICSGCKKQVMAANMYGSLHIGCHNPGGGRWGKPKQPEKRSL